MGRGRCGSSCCGENESAEGVGGGFGRAHGWSLTCLVDGHFSTVYARKLYESLGERGLDSPI